MNETSPRGTTKQHAQKISKEKLSRRLHEMNEQFDAIEALTTNMEQDIQRSNRVRSYRFLFIAVLIVHNANLPVSFASLQ